MLSETLCPCKVQPTGEVELGAGLGLPKGTANIYCLSPLGARPAVKIHPAGSCTGLWVVLRE